MSVSCAFEKTSTHLPRCVEPIKRSFQENLRFTWLYEVWWESRTESKQNWVRLIPNGIVHSSVTNSAFQTRVSANTDIFHAAQHPASSANRIGFSNFNSNGQQKKWNTSRVRHGGIAIVTIHATKGVRLIYMRNLGFMYSRALSRWGPLNRCRCESVSKHSKLEKDSIASQQSP